MYRVGHSITNSITPMMPQLTFIINLCTKIR
ncbi:hypothetical protein ACVQ90_13190 [Staphylococcus aureus]